MNKFLLGFFGLLLLVSSVGAVEVNASSNINGSAIVDAGVNAGAQVDAVNNDLQHQLVNGVLGLVGVHSKRVDMLYLFLGLSLILLAFKIDWITELIKSGRLLIIGLGILIIFYGVGLV